MGANAKKIDPTAELTDWRARFDALIAEAQEKDPRWIAEVAGLLATEDERVARVLDAPFRSGSLSDAILARFQDDTWRQRAEAAAAELGYTDSEGLERIRLYVHGRLEKLRSLATLLNEPDDAQDLRNNVVYWYAEAKSEWYQYNTRINYTMMKGLIIDATLLLRAALGSAILGELETIFDELDVEVLIDYLHAPLPASYELSAHRRRSQAA